MILLVDDDVRFLQTAERFLGRNTRVCFAHTAKHAFDLISTSGGDFRVALVDLDMPEVNGFDVIDQMHRLIPDLPVVAISGVVGAHVLDSAKALGAAETLRKPVTSEWQQVIDRVSRKKPSAGA